jgi:hypothetical protein
LSRGGAAIPLTVIAGAILIAACTDIPSGANDILSFQFDPLPSPSVVVGDSLRDTLGVVRGISLKAYNYSGTEVSSPPVTFTALDRGIRVDSVTGIVRGDSVRASARIVATLRALTGTIVVAVTQKPDSVTGSNARDSLSYSVVDTTNISNDLSVKVLTFSPMVATDSSVGQYLVSFKVVSPTDTALARLVNDNSARSSIDTTNTAGIAGRKIKLDPVRLTQLVDSVIVQAFVKYRGVNVRGSPVRLVLKVKPK